MVVFGSVPSPPVCPALSRNTFYTGVLDGAPRRSRIREARKREEIRCLLTEYKTLHIYIHRKKPSASSDMEQQIKSRSEFVFYDISSWTYPRPLQAKFLGNSLPWFGEKLEQVLLLRDKTESSRIYCILQLLREGLFCMFILLLLLVVATLLLLVLGVVAAVAVVIVAAVVVAATRTVAADSAAFTYVAAFVAAATIDVVTATVVAAAFVASSSSPPPPSTSYCSFYCRFCLLLLLPLLLLYYFLLQVLVF